MIKMQSRHFCWLLIVAVIGGTVSATAQDDDAQVHVVVSLKGQQNPKNARGNREHKLSPELRVLQRVDGGVLVGRTKRNEAVISTTKRAAGHLAADSERHGIDLNTNLGDPDPVNQLILSYTDNPPSEESLKKMGLEVVEDYKLGTFLVVRPMKGWAITGKMADALSADPRVKRAYPSHRLSVAPPDPAVENRLKSDPERKQPREQDKPGIAWPKTSDVRSQINPISPDDADFNRLWGMKAINAPLAWTVTTNSPVIVAVIDTGVDYEHPDLQANMWRSSRGTYGYNALTRQEDPMDDNGHGTHCAGTIAAVANNHLGVVGVTWNVKVMGVKFLGADGAGSDFDAIRGIDYALREGASVLSNSWGGTGYVPELDEAIGRAKSRGALFIAAAGNESNDNEGEEQNYPSSYEQENVIAVMSIDPSGERSSFSNFGRTNVHLAAPGRDIFSTYPGRRYKSLNGTSMATPHVAGAAALIWGHPRYRGANWQTIKRALESNVTRLPSLKNLCVTEGLLNLAFLADPTSSAPGNPPEKPPVERPTPGQPPVPNELVARAAAAFKEPRGVVDAGNLLHVRLQLTEPSEVWLRADTSVTSDIDIVDASVSFLNEECVDRRWTGSARHFSLTAGHWTAVSATYSVTLEAGQHDLYWKIWDEDSSGRQLTLNAGTMTVEVMPGRKE